MLVSRFCRINLVDFGIRPIVIRYVKPKRVRVFTENFTACIGSFNNLIYYLMSFQAVSTWMETECENAICM